MKAATWFRIAGVVLLVFAAGHTFGFLTFRPATAEGQQVWAQMNTVKFVFNGSVFTYGGFYLGFGLFVTLSLTFEGWLAWFLAGMAARGIGETRVIAWVLFVVQVVSVGLSVRYFGAPPVVTSVAAAVCLGMGAAKAGRENAASVSEAGWVMRRFVTN